MTGKQPHEHGRDGTHPAKRHQMENPEKYGQTPSEVSKHRGAPHPGVKERDAGTKDSGGIKGGERAKPGQMAGDEDKPAKED